MMINNMNDEVLKKFLLDTLLKKVIHKMLLYKSTIQELLKEEKSIIGEIILQQGKILVFKKISSSCFQSHIITAIDNITKTNQEFLTMTQNC